jgi:hypothetical protein
VSRLGLLGVAVTLLAIGFAYAYPRLSPRARPDFDGRVVEKFVALGESRMGSATFPRLVVETAGGARFNVGVNDEQYGRARVGMWLSRRDGELILSWDRPQPGAPRGDGDRMKAR